MKVSPGLNCLSTGLPFEVGFSPPAGLVQYLISAGLEAFGRRALGMVSAIGETQPLMQ